MGIITVSASPDSVEKVANYISEQLEKVSCPMKTQMQIGVAVEEIFANIVNYAYGEETGEVEISVDTEDAPNNVTIVFKDSGIQYNPLEKEDPDITLSSDDRPIGGLGVFMVKKLMDYVVYRYEEGRNILEIRKAI